MATHQEVLERGGSVLLSGSCACGGQGGFPSCTNHSPPTARRARKRQPFQVFAGNCLPYGLRHGVVMRDCVAARKNPTLGGPDPRLRTWHCKLDSTVSRSRWPNRSLAG